jgi:LmbE family N-acetylglucosaminyl deacetylase
MDLPEEMAAMLRPPEISGCKRALCVQPHPDDNEVGMGGIIALLAGKGCEVHYLTVTDGSQGSLDPALTPERIAPMRREEAIAAGMHLGVRRENFHFLDHEDGSLSDVVALSWEIVKVIRQVRPEAVFAPDPNLAYEGHWDHIVTGRAAANAFQASGRLFLDTGGEAPWNASAIGYYFTAQPNTVLDVTPFFERKFEALALHRSQINAEILGMYRAYFQLKATELAAGRGFALGEGLKVLSLLQNHCFVDAGRI